MIFLSVCRSYRSIKYKSSLKMSHLQSNLSFIFPFEIGNIDDYMMLSVIQLNKSVSCMKKVWNKWIILQCSKSIAVIQQYHLGDFPFANLATYFVNNPLSKNTTSRATHLKIITNPLTSSCVHSWPAFFKSGIGL